MEDNILNINQPLLSVRRFSSIATSQEDDKRKNASYLPTTSSFEHRKTESKLDRLSNTGSIPFVWEHSPGRPKDETRTQSQTKESPPSLPKLPPGRIIKHNKEDSDSTTENANVKKDPTMNRSILRAVLPTEEKTTLECANSSKTGSSDSSDDDNDEEFMDALDTLSRGESSIYNCSASGASGLGLDLKPSGTLPADRKLRDFMMDRFLPAAKAMTSEAPQYTSRKPVMKEKPQLLKKSVNHSKKLQLRYGPTFLQDEAHDDEDNEEDSVYGYDEHRNKPSKLCGMIPRFCTKGSLCLLNPIPGMRTRLSMCPPNRTQASSSSISSTSETDNEPARIAIYEHRPVDSSQSANHQKDNIVSKSESVETNRKLEGSRLYNRLQGYGIPYETFQSIVSESSRKKCVTRFKDLLSETDGQDSIVEKTLYVDTIRTVKQTAKIRSCYDTETPKVQTISSESAESDMLAEEPKHDMKTKMHSLPWKDPALDDVANMKASRDGVKEATAPPPLPKSPSDSWLQRTLPSLSSKNAPGSLVPIPET